MMKDTMGVSKQNIVHHSQSYLFSLCTCENVCEREKQRARTLGTNEDEY